MQTIVTRAYNRFEIDEVRGMIRKLSSTPRLRDEINYYTKLSYAHPDKSAFFPRMFASHTEGEDFWMDLELYDYPNLGNFLVSQNPTLVYTEEWKQVFLNLREILNQFSGTFPYSSWSDDEIRTASYDMYITKTEREQKALYDAGHTELENMFVGKEISINNLSYHTFDIIWPEVKAYIEQNMLDFAPTLIHGDFCFSNILYGKDKKIFRFIDPRGSFGKMGIYGDIRYDVAKLYHSVDGTYEAFITDNFEITEHSPAVFRLFIENTLSVKDVFEEVFFPNYSKKEIKILQGCIFIGMCARHYDSRERQKAMYLTGIRLLNEGLSL